jgi:hypothetical protein
MITFLEDCEESGNFLEPVNFKELNLPDYPRIIKHPMDLSTCKKKLNHGKYYNIEKFNKDLSQIWENCRVYNQVGSLIVQQADAMEEHQKKYLADNPLPDTIPQKRSRDDEEENQSLEAKILIAEKIRNASQEGLLKVLKIVKHNSKNALEKLGEYYRVKIDLLDGGVVEQIHK